MAKRVHDGADASVKRHCVGPDPPRRVEIKPSIHMKMRGSLLARELVKNRTPVGFNPLLQQWNATTQDVIFAPGVKIRGKGIRSLECHNSVVDCHLDTNLRTSEKRSLATGTRCHPSDTRPFVDGLPGRYLQPSVVAKRDNLTPVDIIATSDKTSMRLYQGKGNSAVHRDPVRHVSAHLGVSLIAEEAARSTYSYGSYKQPHIHSVHDNMTPYTMMLEKPASSTVHITGVGNINASKRFPGASVRAGSDVEDDGYLVPVVFEQGETLSPIKESNVVIVTGRFHTIEMLELLVNALLSDPDVRAALQLPDDLLNE